MKKLNNNISEQAAIQLLGRIFNKTPDSDSLTLDEIYIAADRSQLDATTNRNWLNNVMTKLRKHNLIKPNYTYDGRKKLFGIKLSATGKSVLGRAQSTDSYEDYDDFSANSHRKDLDEVNLAKLTRSVSLFKKQNPDFEVVFSVTLKEVD